MKYILLLILALAVSTVYAQERAAAGPTDTQMIWTSLANKIDALTSQVEALNNKVDMSVKCGKKGLIYAPGVSGTDVDICMSATQVQPKGTLAGYCSQGWGGVDQIGPTSEPAYFDNGPHPATNADSSAYAASQGWTMHKGCSCRSGWEINGTGTCTQGNCTIPSAGGTKTSGLFYYNCVKL